MKKFGIAVIVASGLATAVVGLSGPAQADNVHRGWVLDNQQTVNVDSTPRFGNGR